VVRQVYGRSRDTGDYGSLVDCVAGAVARVENAPRKDVDTDFQKVAGRHACKEDPETHAQLTDTDVVDLRLDAVAGQTTGSLSWQRRGLRYFARGIYQGWGWPEHGWFAPTALRTMEKEYLPLG
jgi:hypothetical protein